MKAKEFTFSYFLKEILDEFEWDQNKISEKTKERLKNANFMTENTFGAFDYDLIAIRHKHKKEIAF